MQSFNLKSKNDFIDSVGLAQMSAERNLAKWPPISSHAGYDVIERQSGKKAAPTKISKKGNHHIRGILHMSSMSLITYKVEPFYNLWTRVCERTRIKIKVYVDVQRKLLTVLYTLEGVVLGSFFRLRRSVFWKHCTYYTTSMKSNRLSFPFG